MTYAAGNYLGLHRVRAPAEDRVGGAQPGLLLRGARRHLRAAARSRLTAAFRRLPADAAVVPGLLLLIARDLALHDPPRVLAWRLLHDPRLAQLPAWLAALPAAARARPGPRPRGAPPGRGSRWASPSSISSSPPWAPARSRAARGRSRRRASLSWWSRASLSSPWASPPDRPYGQDGGVVQLPLALDRILAGESPYGADYSRTMLGRQARASSFWEALGREPHPPPPRLPARHPPPDGAVLPRGARPRRPLRPALRRPCSSTRSRSSLAARAARRRAAAPHRGGRRRPQPARLLAPDLRRERPAVRGPAAGRRAPGPRGPRHRRGRAARPRLRHQAARLALRAVPALLTLRARDRFADLGAPGDLGAHWPRPLVAAARSSLAVVLPVAALDFRAFWGDIVVYNVGLPGADNYPLGGTPGFGFANFLIYFGRVASLRDYVPVRRLLRRPRSRWACCSLRRQLREGRPWPRSAPAARRSSLSLYFSRVVHPNYLIPAAVLLPLASPGAAPNGGRGPRAVAASPPRRRDRGERGVSRRGSRPRRPACPRVSAASRRRSAPRAGP